MKNRFFLFFVVFVFSGFFAISAIALAVEYYPDGTLLRDQTNRIYVIKDQKKLHLKNLVELQKYKNQKIVYVDKSVTQSIQDYLESKYPDGVLLKSKNGKIYLIKDQKKLYIANLNELRKYAKAKMYLVDDSIINSFKDFKVQPISDLTLLEGMIKEFRRLELAGNMATSTYKSFLSAKTIEAFSDWKLETSDDITNIEYINFKRDGKNYIATQKNTHKNGRIEVFDGMVFVNENNSWKYGLYESLERLEKIMETEEQEWKTRNLSDGKVDFVVTDIKVWPANPKVNDKNTEAEIFIKNIGTNAGLYGVNLNLEISDSNQFLGNYGILEVIKPGQTVSAVKKIYDGLIEKEPDEPGLKTISVEIGSFGSSTDDIVDNNKFSKQFRFVQ